MFKGFYSFEQGKSSIDNQWGSSFNNELYDLTQILILIETKFGTFTAATMNLMSYIIIIFLS